MLEYSLVSDVMNSINSDGCAVVEVSCEHTDDSKKYINSLAKTIHEKTGFDVGYHQDGNDYHLIINREKKQNA